MSSANTPKIRISYFKLLFKIVKSSIGGPGLSHATQVYGITLMSVLFLAYYDVRGIFYKTFLQHNFHHPRHRNNHSFFFGLIIFGTLVFHWMIIGTPSWLKWSPVNVNNTAVFRGCHYSLVFLHAKHHYKQCWEQVGVTRKPPWAPSPDSLVRLRCWHPSRFMGRRFPRWDRHHHKHRGHNLTAPNEGRHHFRGGTIESETCPAVVALARRPLRSNNRWPVAPRWVVFEYEGNYYYDQASRMKSFGCREKWLIDCHIVKQV